jgi:uncharacterized membrane protein
MWALSHGSAYVSLFDVNFFANHANLIALLLVPLYKIFPSPVTLLVLKLISFFSASFVLYLLAKERLGESLALLVMGLFWAYSANIFGLMYEFDFENLALPFVMFMIYFYAHDNWKGFIINSIVLIFIKENLPLVVLGFGIHGLLTKTDKLRWALVPIVLGAVSFYTLAFVFVPLMGKHTFGEHPYMVHYASLLKQPAQALSSVIALGKYEWFKQLFGPLLWLPLLALGVLLPIALIFLQHLLSIAWQEETIYFGYTMTIAPFVFWAFICALVRIKKNFSKKIFYSLLFLIVLSSGDYLAANFSEMRHRFMVFKDIKETSFDRQLLKMVPVQAPVIASFNFLAPLSQRPYVYAFHKIYDQAYQKAGFRLPDNVQYALINFNDMWYKADLHRYHGFTEQRVKAFLASGWVPLKSFNKTVLFKRKG